MVRNLKRIHHPAGLGFRFARLFMGHGETSEATFSKLNSAVANF